MGQTPVGLLCGNNRRQCATLGQSVEDDRFLYPFAILFRELPVDRHEELIRRAMRWPDPLAIGAGGRASNFRHLGYSPSFNECSPYFKHS